MSLALNGTGLLPNLDSLVASPRSFDQDVRIPPYGRPNVRNFYVENSEWNGGDPWLSRINNGDETSTPENVDRDFVDQSYRRRMRRKHRNGFIRRRFGNDGPARHRLVEQSADHGSQEHNGNHVDLYNNEDDIYNSNEANGNEDNNIYSNNEVAYYNSNEDDGTVNSKKYATKVQSRDAILIGERKPEFYGSSPGSGSYPKYYYENNPEAEVHPVYGKVAQRVDPESSDGILTKIFNFFDRFFNYWTEKGNVGEDDNVATSSNDAEAYSDALKRTDDAEEDTGSSIGNYLYTNRRTLISLNFRLIEWLSIDPHRKFFTWGSD